MEQEPFDSKERGNEKREESPEREYSDAELEGISGGAQKTNTIYSFYCKSCEKMSFSREAPVTVCSFCGSEDGLKNRASL